MGKLHTFFSRKVLGLFRRLKHWATAKIKRLAAQMSQTAIAILSAATLLFVLSISIFSSARAFCILHPGVMIVALAVAGEVWCDWNRKKGLREKLKKACGVLLVCGLLLEIREAIKTDREVAVLHDHASSNELAVAQLKHENLALEAKLQTRRITPAQKRAFIDFLRNCPKVEVKVFVGVMNGVIDSQTETYAGQIRKMLDEAGCSAGEKGGIVYVNNLRYIGGIDDPARDAPLQLVFRGENKDVTDWPGLTMWSTNGMTYMRVAETNDVRSAPFHISQAFQTIGITPGVLLTKFIPALPNEGDWGVFIQQRF